MTERPREPESFDDEVVAMAHQLVDGLNISPLERDQALSYVYHRLDRLLRAWRARKRWADRERLRRALSPSPN